MSKNDKIIKILDQLIFGSLLLTVPVEIYLKSWHALMMSLFSIFVICTAKFFLKKSDINLPVEFSLFLTVFIYCSVFLGEGNDFYTKFWWWDLVLHTSSGMVFGFVGFMILYILYRIKKFTASVFLIALFTFSFSVAIGAIWEILEFTMDQLFKTNMQRSGLLDTMKDLIVDTVGALITSVCGYFYLKKSGDSFDWFETLLERFVHKNPKLVTKLKKQS